MNRLLFILLVQIPIFLSAQNRLQFVGENIDFEINTSRFSTNGIYIFTNPSSHKIEQTILFPFSEEADSIQVRRVYNLSTSQNLDFQMVDKGIVFKVFVETEDTVAINIYYSQTTELENTYVLKSTQTWGEPLQSAKYSLTYDESVVIDSLSYKPDSKEGNVYYWNKSEFLPNEDFKILIK
jgi:hypothetical protein